MISRLSVVTALLVAGHAVLFGLYWLLLSIPESNAAMLAASAVVTLVGLLVFGWVEGLALLAWRDDASRRSALTGALRAVPAVWLGAILFLLVSLAVGYVGHWWVEHRGETDAWLMLHFGWAETGKLHVAAGWFFLFLTRVVGLSLSVTLAAAVARGNYRSLARTAWLRAGLSPLRLAIVAAIVIVFVWVGSHGATWRVASLSPNWQETVFVTVKLALVYIFLNVGWALVLGTARRDA